MTRITLADVATAEVALVQGGDPPTEFRIFGAGINRTTKGDLLFDDKAAREVMAAYHQRGRKRLAGDWEHASVVAMTDPGSVANGGVPASMWFTPEVRQTGQGPELWATEVKFTPKAFAQLSAGEYAHFSPAVLFDRKSGRVTRLLSVALTNEPATIAQDQLVAASDDSTTERTMMKLPEKYTSALRSLMDGDYPDEAAAMAAASKCLGDLFGKKEPDGDEGKAVGALRDLSGKDTVDEGIAVLSAWRDASARVKTLSDEIASLKAERSKTEIAAALEAAKVGGKLAPAVLSDAALAEPQTAAGKFIARCSASGDLVTLSAYIDALPKLVGAESRPAPAADLVTLTDEDKTRARVLGLTDDQALKAKRERLGANV